MPGKKQVEDDVIEAGRLFIMFSRVSSSPHRRNKAKAMPRADRSDGLLATGYTLAQAVELVSGTLDRVGVVWNCRLAAKFAASSYKG
jgi:hypothetical protein